VLQSYSAYTSWLDHLDASFLASSRAPSRLIVQNTGGSSIDSRVLSFDEPEATMEILCRYRPLLTLGAYAILGRVASRCSAAHEIKTVHAGWGQRVTVPHPPTARSVVLVKISGVQIRGFGLIRDLVWSSALRFIRLNDGEPRRLIVGTADDGLPLLASKGIDFSRPYSVAPDAHTISVSEAGQGSSTLSQPITYSFYAVNVS
jgi:hypothetical protein